MSESVVRRASDRWCGKVSVVIRSCSPLLSWFVVWVLIVDVAMAAPYCVVGKASYCCVGTVGDADLPSEGARRLPWSVDNVSEDCEAGPADSWRRLRMARTPTGDSWKGPRILGRSREWPGAASDAEQARIACRQAALRADH